MDLWVLLRCRTVQNPLFRC